MSESGFEERLYRIDWYDPALGYGLAEVGQGKFVPFLAADCREGQVGSFEGVQVISLTERHREAPEELQAGDFIVGVLNKERTMVCSWTPNSTETRLLPKKWTISFVPWAAS